MHQDKKLSKKVVLYTIFFHYKPSLLYSY